MVFKAFVVLAVIGFVGAGVLDKVVLTKMANDVTVQYKEDLGKLASEVDVNVAYESFLKQKENEVDLNEFIEENDKDLTDNDLSQAAKECLRSQREKAKGFAQETRAKVKACRDSKKDEVATVREKGLAAWRKARKNAEELREQAKQCVKTSTTHEEGVECLKKVAQAAREGALELGKALREVFSELRRLAGEVAKCAKKPLLEFRENMGQVRKDAKECLKLADN